MEQVEVLVEPRGRSNRVALVLAAAKYEKMPSLKAPLYDATEVHNRLAAWGWTTICVVDSRKQCTDADGERMRDAVQEFIKLTHGAEASLVYFSGHGFHYRPQNKHYLLGKDYGTKCPSLCEPISIQHELSLFAYSIEDLMYFISPTCTANVCILDCCRTGVKGLDRTWSELKAPADANDKDFIICFAAVQDRPAHDSLEDGSFSFFTDGIVKEVLTNPEYSVSRAFDYAQKYTVEKYGKDWKPETRNTNGVKFNQFYLAPDELRVGRPRGDDDVHHVRDVQRPNAYARPPPREVDVMKGKGLVHEVIDLGFYHFKRGPCIIPSRLRTESFKGQQHFQQLMRFREICDDFLRTTENVTLNALSTDLLANTYITELPDLQPAQEHFIPVQNLRTWMMFDERDEKKMRKVQEAMKQRISPEDVWTCSQFDKQEVSRWATYEGARITNPLNFVYGRCEGRGEVDELGVLLYPDNSEPYHVLVFHLHIDVRAVCERVVAKHKHTNTVTIKLQVRKFKLGADA